MLRRAFRHRNPDRQVLTAPLKEDPGFRLTGKIK